MNGRFISSTESSAAARAGATVAHRLRVAHIATTITLGLLTGCTRAPSFNVLGSYFPGWLACMIAGILLASFLRLLLIRLRVDRNIPYLPLFYLSSAALIAELLWLAIFE